ncbi:hypothetical protein A4G19_03615 [Pasteurellaceae bacterium Macca]|nr:hypothetical protein [Pasteurellaceae bacterium Macca]
MAALRNINTKGIPNYANGEVKGKNARIFNLSVAMELAVLECDKLGLEIEKVEFDGKFSPRLFVKSNAKTARLQAEGKAHFFGITQKHGVTYDLVKMPLANGSKIIWLTDRLH